MRRPWTLVVLLLLFLPSVTARADPAISMPAPGERVAQWTLSNPNNYTFDNVTLDATGGRLAWLAGGGTDTDASDFARAPSLVNIDLTVSPGNVRILNASQGGAPQNLTYQPNPSQLADTYLHRGGGGNDNFGTSTDLWVGYWGTGEWNRALIRFTSFPLPFNATVREAHLELYVHTADTPDLMPVAVHRATTPWTEFGATWDTSNGTAPWTSGGGGGDFDPTFVDMVSIGNTTGWYRWNVTSLLVGWWTGTLANDGLLVRQMDDELRAVLGRKQFSSGDEGNAALRPRLLITYTAPGSSGLLESRVIDASGASFWGTVWWNATRPAGAEVLVQTRTGNTVAVDASWSPWSLPYPAPGSLIASPAARYIEYKLSLLTNSSTPVVHDVSVTWRQRAAFGTVVTETLFPRDLTGWDRLEVNWSGPPGTAVAVAYSQDNGTSWAFAVPGQRLTAAFPTAIALRLTLATNDTMLTPVVRSFSLAFRVPGPPGPGILGVVAGWIAALVAIVLGAWIVGRRVLRAPFDATDLFLIHADGRLVKRVGGEQNPIEDDIAVSGMFTLVAQFVKDSFSAPGGAGGELKSFQVDDREVAIAKGEYLFLALVARGPRPESLESSMTEFLREVESEYRAALQDWDGLGASTGELESDLHWYLERGHRRAHPKLPRGDVSPLDTRRESLMARAPRFLANVTRRASGRLRSYREDLSRGRHGRG